MAKAPQESSLRDRYHNGEITVDEFLQKLLNGKDGDRNRRKAERRFNSLVAASSVSAGRKDR